MNNSRLLNSFKDTNYQNSHGEIDNLYRPITIKEIESIINNPESIIRIYW